MIYIDTSALAKLALPERESSEVAALLEGQQLFSSALIDIELSTLRAPASSVTLASR